MARHIASPSRHIPGCDAPGIASRHSHTPLKGVTCDGLSRAPANGGVGGLHPKPMKKALTDPHSRNFFSAGNFRRKSQDDRKTPPRE